MSLRSMKDYLASLTIKVSLGATLILFAANATASVIYVDATDESGGNTSLAVGGTFTAAGTTGGNDGNWAQRAFANSTTVFESRGAAGTGNSTEDSPRLATTISGLTSGATYNFYSFFWDSTDGPQQWMVRSSLTNSVGDLPLFDQTSPLASTLSFSSTPLLTEGNRLMLYADLGTAVANGSGQVVVYVDDNTAGLTNGENRTWYDGIGYEQVPEPGSLLLCASSIGLALFRRQLS
jgi:hypothetical protein